MTHDAESVVLLFNLEAGEAFLVKLLASRFGLCSNSYFYTYFYCYD